LIESAKKTVNTHLLKRAHSTVFTQTLM